jgi:hypothetical protein
VRKEINSTQVNLYNSIMISFKRSNVFIVFSKKDGSSSVKSVGQFYTNEQKTASITNVRYACCLHVRL